MRRAGGVLLLSLAAGCCDEYDNARCGDAPTLDILSFTVTTRTGEDQSDANIFFCVRLRSTPPPGTPICTNLDTTSDDFEEGNLDVFQVTTPVAAGDLARFWLENRGGAFLDNNEWEVVRLRVDATLADGTTTNLYWDREIDCENQIDSGDDYLPKACSY
jgi:hypothetical protein